MSQRDVFGEYYILKIAPKGRALGRDYSLKINNHYPKESRCDNLKSIIYNLQSFRSILLEYNLTGENDG